MTITHRQNPINRHGLKRMVHSTLVRGSMRLPIVTMFLLATADFESSRTRRGMQAELASYPYTCSDFSGDAQNLKEWTNVC